MTIHSLRPCWTLAACVVPWGLPLLTNALTAHNEKARLFAVLIWPVVVLMIGVCMAAMRLAFVPDTRAAVQSAKLRYTNRLTVALFMLFLFELTVGICLAARGPVASVVMLSTSLFYLPYVYFVRRSSEDWLLVLRLHETLKRVKSDPTRLPRPPRWKRQIRAIRYVPHPSLSPDANANAAASNRASSNRASSTDLGSPPPVSQPPGSSHAASESTGLKGSAAELTSAADSRQPAAGMSPLDASPPDSFTLPSR